MCTVDQDLEQIVYAGGCHQFQYKRMCALPECDSLGAAHFANLLRRLLSTSGDGVQQEAYLFVDEGELL